MEKLPLTIIFSILGVIMGLFVTLIFNKLPEKWLQDYDYDPKSPNFRLSKRMKLLPHTLFSSCFCAICYGCAAFFSYDFLFNPLKVINVIILILMIPIVMIVMMSDRLNRIIPDQCSLAILVLGVLAIVGDFFNKPIWFSAEAPWYYSLINRLIALIVGFGLLWAIGFIAECFTGKESMGQGDMKLLGACGLLIGCYGLVVLIYVAAFASVFFAIPILIRKRIRISKEEKAIRESSNPVQARRELNKKKSQIHFADDPDYIAFGPFLALGAAAFLVLEPVFFKLMYDYLSILGWYF